MAQGKVEICGVNTSRLPVLKEEEKEALFVRIKAGDEEAKETYIKGNLRLVLSVIKRFGASNENPDDLFQIGCIGLIKAINNFNTELDVKFSTYAVPMIVYCRERLRVNDMTRKQALFQAIEILSKNKEYNEITDKLREIEMEMPLSCWTKESIIDSILTYAEENNNTLPFASELTKENNLPSNTVIAAKFHMTSMEDFFKEYFPQYIIKDRVYKSSSPYKNKDTNFFITTFQENYERIKIENNINYVSTKTYDKNKKEGSPALKTIMCFCNCKTYNELLILCGLKKRMKLEVHLNCIGIDEEHSNEDLKKTINDIIKELKNVKNREVY